MVGKGWQWVVRLVTGLDGTWGLILEGESTMKSDAKTLTDKTEKNKAIDLAVAQIEKQFGQGSIMRLGDESAILPVESIPTGSLSLDIALGVGGVPRGRVIEVYGPEGSGKTTLTSSIIARAQMAGGMAAFVDAEHAFDVGYAKKIGIDVENLLISQPDTGEQALEIVEVLVRSSALDVVVVDSVAALVPAAELNGDMGDAHVGLQARLMSQALRKLTGVVSKSRTSLIFTNQIRMKIGVMFGSPETTSGGNALKFYSSVRMDIRRIGALKEGDTVSGNRTKVKVVKNKVAPPFRIAEFDILYGEGISYEGDVIDIGASIDVIKKSGTWYSYGDERLGQGKEAARKFLKSNPELRDEVDKKIRAHFAIEPAAGAAGDGAAKATASTAKKGAAEKVAVPPAITAGKSRTGARATKK
jgi:recombination protein RecA